MSIMVTDENREDPVSTPPVDEEGPIVIGVNALIDRMIDAGIIEPTDGGDDLILTSDFADRWWSEISTHRDDGLAKGRLAELLEMDEDDVSLEDTTGAFVAYHNEEEIGDWPSRSAFIADISLYPVMDEWFDLWGNIDATTRSELIGRFRAFLESCPSCEGRLDFDEDHDSVTDAMSIRISCEACQDVLVEGQYS